REARRHLRDAVVIEQLRVVLVDGRDEGGDGDVDRERPAVVLRHVDGDGVAADAVRALVDLDLEALGVAAQRPRRAESRDACADDADALSPAAPLISYRGAGHRSPRP